MGYGDEIMATAEAREAKKKFPNAKIVIGDGKKTYPSIIYLNNQFNIKGVYTQPPKKSDRGQKLKLSSVHEFAENKKSVNRSSGKKFCKRSS